MPKGNPKLWRKKSGAEGIGITPHQIQLEPGEIYLCGWDFKYVYTLTGELLLELDSVCDFFHLYAFRELESIPPKYLRRVEYHISKVLPPTRRFYIVRAGVPRLANRGHCNRKYKRDVLKLYKDYDQRPIKKGSK